MTDTQNIFDDQEFFNRYQAMSSRERNYNTLVEKPAIFGMLPELTGKSILDLGCGFGENCAAFRDMGAERVVGIDVSRRMLEVAKDENPGDDISFFQMDMNELDRLDGKFHVIFSSLAFHYIEDLDELLEKIHGKLRPGGVLVFSQEHPLTTAPRRGPEWEEDPNEGGERYLLQDYGRPGRRSTAWYVDGVIKYHRTFSMLCTSLIRAGFVIEDMAEPLPAPEQLKELPHMERELHKPSFLVIRAKRVTKRA